jgi:hypothetical protein
MATSKVEICNLALIELGADTIASLNDDTKEARACNLIYESERKKLLRSHPWNFAIGRQSLALLSTSPSFEYLYQFPLPTDCIRALYLYNSREAFVVEGGYLLTNELAPKLIYIKDITDPNTFDSAFVELFSLSLASKICYSITGSGSLKQALYQQMRAVKIDAKNFDGQEGTMWQLPDGDWLDTFIDNN